MISVFSQEVSGLVQALGKGDEEAVYPLAPIVADQARRLTHRSIAHTSMSPICSLEGPFEDDL